MIECARSFASQQASVYGQMRALDEAAALDFETSSALRDLGVSALQRVLPVNPPKALLPPISNEAMTFEVKADAAALERYRAQLGGSTPRPVPPNGNLLQQTSVCCVSLAERVTKAIETWSNAASPSLTLARTRTPRSPPVCLLWHSGVGISSWHARWLRTRLATGPDRRAAAPERRAEGCWRRRPYLR